MVIIKRTIKLKVEVVALINVVIVFQEILNEHLGKIHQLDEGKKIRRRMCFGVGREVCVKIVFLF